MFYVAVYISWYKKKKKRNASFYPLIQLRVQHEDTIGRITGTTASKSTTHSEMTDGWKMICEVDKEACWA